MTLFQPQGILLILYILYLYMCLCVCVPHGNFNYCGSEFALTNDIVKRFPEDVPTLLGIHPLV